MSTTSTAETSAAPRADRFAQRRGWLLERSPVSMARFRVLAASGLAVHFAAHWLDTPSLFAWSSPGDLAMLGHSAVAPWLGSLSERSLALLFALGVGLAAATALGV